MIFRWAEMLQLAETYSRPQLEKEVLEFFRGNKTEIVKGKGWTELKEKDAYFVIKLFEKL